MLYLRLFHGRTRADQQMDDWGSDGPVFGPYKYIHTTYSWHLKCGRSGDICDELFAFEGMIYYNGIYYGDWSICGPDELEPQFSISQFKQQKARLPHKTG